MRKEKIQEYLLETIGLELSSPDDLVNALFYGEVNIFENVPVYPDAYQEEYRKLSKQIEDTLLEKYPKTEALEMIDRLNEIRALQIEGQFKHCFREGIKIGFTMAQLMKEE